MEDFDYNRMHVYAKKGYISYPIVGMGYRNLSITDDTDFVGHVECDDCNEYDEYAIAVYDDEDTHLGYLPKGNKRLFDYLKSNDEESEAYGKIVYEDGKLSGTVCVKIK